MKKFLAVAMIFAIMISQLAVVNADEVVEEFPTEYWESREEDAPVLKDGYYEIRTPENLAWISDLARDFYPDFDMNNIILMNDINMGGKLWRPIKSFNYDFFGQNYTIRNLTTNTASDKQGLIAYTSSDTEVRNLYLEDVNITGGKLTGAVVGSNLGKVRNCYVTGAVNGTDCAGGIVGYNNLAFDIDTGETHYIGTVEDCYANVKVTGNIYVGGILGSGVSEVIGCGFDGAVYGTGYVGGISGSGPITDCYSRGDVYNTAIINDPTADNTSIYKDARNTGTVCGTGDITNCYSTGSVTFAMTDEQLANIERTSPLTGYDARFEHTIVNSYYDSETSGFNLSVTAEGVYAKTTAEMKSPMMAALLNKGGDVWRYKATLNDGYPILDWQFKNDSGRITLNPDLYIDLTTDEIWRKMQVQVFLDKSDWTLIVKDGNNYYTPSKGNRISQDDLVGAYDIDHDGEYELLFINNWGSGIYYESLWCYSKTKDIHCAFDVRMVSPPKVRTSVVESNDGTFYLCMQGNNDGKLAIEQVDGNYWLTVTYPEDAVFDVTNLADIEKLVANRKKSGKTTLLHKRNFFAGENSLSIGISTSNGEIIARTALPTKKEEVVVICLYKDDVIVETHVVTGKEDTQVTVKSQLLKEIDCIKLMLWDRADTMVPVCAPFEFSLEY